MPVVDCSGLHVVESLRFSSRFPRGKANGFFPNTTMQGVMRTVAASAKSQAQRHVASVQVRVYSTRDTSLAYAIMPNFERGYQFKSPYNTVTVLGAPFSDGQQFTGSDEGPRLLREAGLYSVLKDLKWRVTDKGDLKFRKYKNSDPVITPENEELLGGTCNQPYVVGQACKLLFESVREIAAESTFPLIIGGDHSLGMGTVPGILAERPDTAVIWVDAHADVNTPATSGSGNMHGMPVAFFTENGIDYDKIPGCEWMKDMPKLDPKNLVYIGLRDLDHGERKYVVIFLVQLTKNW